MKLGDIVVRADAGAGMGTGHLTRCLSLAAGWAAAGGSVTVATATDNRHLRKLAQRAGAGLVSITASHPDPADLEATTALIARRPGAWVILDGYHFDTAYQRALRDVGARLMVIDDYASAGHYVADVLLNQNLGAEELSYSVEPYTRKLLGTKYALLASHFEPWRDWRRSTPDVARRILVTLGGGDPGNQTLKVIRALRRLDLFDMEVAVVIGAANPHRATLESDLAGLRRFRLLENVEDMPKLMAWADLAVSGGGSTCWELAFMGLPSAMVVLAENQAGIARGLERAGVAEKLGWYEDVNVSFIQKRVDALVSGRQRRAEMSLRGRELVDGRGVCRVISELRGESVSLVGA